MSAERPPPERRFKRWALVGLLVATACIGNLDDDAVGVTSTRYMDELCAKQSYALLGNAVRTTGLTSDTCGFVLGPGAGSVSFQIDLTEGFDSYQVLALVTRRDHTGWEAIGSSTPGAASGTFSVSTDSERIQVVDVRVRGVYSSANCD